MTKQPFETQSLLWRRLEPLERAKTRLEFLETLNCDPALSPLARCIGTLLITKYLNQMAGHPRFGCAWPGQETLGNDVGCCERTAREHTKALVDAGWFLRERRAGFVYLPNWPRRHGKSTSGAQSIDTKRQCDVGDPEEICRSNRKVSSAEPAYNPINKPVESTASATASTCVPSISHQPRVAGPIGTPQTLGSAIQREQTPVASNPSLEGREQALPLVGRPVYKAPRDIQKELVDVLEAELGIDPEKGWLVMMEISRARMRALEEMHRSGTLSAKEIMQAATVHHGS